MLGALRSPDGRIYPSVVFVRGANLAVWACVFPVASPMAWYIAGVLPLWLNRATLMLGALLIVALPIATPQSAGALQAVEQRLSERMDRADQAQQSQINANRDAITKIQEDTRLLPTMSDDVKLIKEDMSNLVTSLLVWALMTLAGIVTVIVRRHIKTSIGDAQ